MKLLIFIKFVVKISQLMFLFAIASGVDLKFINQLDISCNFVLDNLSECELNKKLIKKKSRMI